MATIKGLLKRSPDTPEAPGVHPQALWSFRPRSDREAGDAIVSNLLLHWFPSKVYKPSLDWSYSFWLGTASAALFLLLVVSGLPLLMLYVPSVERAYQSVKDIEYVVTFGWWIRAVHRISAHLMVVAVALHLVRVFLTGAYKNGVGQGQCREWNWVIGVVMLLLTLFLSFTGYLLPWDQLAFWAVTVGTNIASSIPWIGPTVRELLIGGRTIEQATLIRFYVLHCIMLPGALGVLFAYHMWRVRKDGGLAKADHEAVLANQQPVPPVASKTYTLLGVARGTAPTVKVTSVEAPDLTVSAVPDLTRRAAIVVLATFALVSILASAIPSPLEEPANALVTPNPAKAPWYFLWLQEIVTDTTIRIGSFTINGAFLGGVILPGLLITLLTVWPWLDRSSALSTGRWFPKDRRTQNAMFLALVLLVLVFTVIGMFLRGPYWNFYWPWEAWPEIPARI
ncbi:MAG: Cytochrome b/b6 domain protein [Acidobacteria bacterium]|jgi:quinol-cytochrome oxidoreductase complex cytochrome b subunit|nr:Cytochrome b/b6 domain protein [Acidobacteriota bacterium]